MKPEKGMRIVPFEKRLKVKYPMDCEVRFYTGDKEIPWLGVSFNTSWKNKHFIIAVPSDYVFEEDR